MKKILNAAAIIVSVSVAAAQAQPAPAVAAQTNMAPTEPAPVRPNTAIIPNLNKGFMAAHSNNLVVAEKGDSDILFMGDSITDWWRNPGRGGPIDGAIPYGGKEVFEKHFAAMKVANFGIAGDTTQGVLWRLQNGEGKGIKPKGIMLMIGTNNTGRNTPEEIEIGVADVVFELRKDFPDAKILLLGIFPRSTAKSKVRAQIEEINKTISALNDSQHVFYMDIGSKFLAADGSIPKDIMSDSLHPTSKGYEIWAGAVHDTLASYLQ